MSVRIGNNIIAGAGGGNINNATITITQGGVTKGSFTLNQAADETIALDAGGGGGAVDSVNGKTGVVVLTASDVGALPDNTVIPDAQIQSDWNQSDNTKLDYIKNKPTIPTVNNSTITITQGGVTKGTFTTNQASAGTIALDAGSSDGYHPDLFDVKWADHICNDVQWLRADTFSWQSGAVYQVAYQHLADDIDGKTLQSETVAGTTIQFYLADDGHKICPASEESNVTAIYNATGVAWYYIIDIANTSFKLPRTQFGFTGIRNGVGRFIEAALPNITGSINTNQDALGVASGAFSLQNNGTTTATGSHAEYAHIKQNILFNAHNLSSIYKDGATVQPKATEMYLYFYVGNFTQTALENTAGVTTEVLNDLNAHKVIEFQEPTAQNNYTWYRKYADGWVEQGGITAATSANPASVTYPVIMLDSNYTLTVSAQTPQFTTASTIHGCHYIAKETTRCTIVCLEGNSGTWIAGNISWQVSGMAA